MLCVGVCCMGFCLFVLCVFVVCWLLAWRGVKIVLFTATQCWLGRCWLKSSRDNAVHHIKVCITAYKGRRGVWMINQFTHKRYILNGVPVCELI